MGLTTYFVVSARSAKAVHQSAQAESDLQPDTYRSLRSGGVVPPAPTTVAATKKPFFTEYTVAQNDTLSEIAVLNNISLATLQASNPGVTPSNLQPGATLKIPSENGVLYTVKRGDTVWDIAVKYRIDATKIADRNGLGEQAMLQPGDVLMLPGAQPIAVVSQAPTQTVSRGSSGSSRASTSTATSSGGFIWPVRGWISSGYGQREDEFHKGIDIAVSIGTPVHAAMSGNVIYAASGWNGGYGTLVIIDHGNGYVTKYAHNSRLNVSVGDYVKQGAVVSYSGSTGHSTGPHVHFEIYKNGATRNPRSYLP
jgi:murein DD-endopeptidase MepM/ murein hydrolase activator NlpD